jgi:ribose transport system substrate-binding protein
MKKTALFLALLLTLCSYGCSSSEDLVVEEKDITIEVIVKSEGVEFWETAVKGAEDASKELGIKVNCEATPTESDVDMQIELLQNAINDGVDAIVVGPLDTTALNDTLQVANSKNIPVITIDSSVTYSGVKSLVGTQNETAGAIAARNLATCLNDKGDVIVITHGDDTVITAKERKDGFINEMQESYPSISVLDWINGQADKETSKKLVEDYITAHPTVEGIYATNESVAVGACEAVLELGRDDISIIGFDSSDAEVNYIKDDVLKGTMVQNPYLMGYLGVRNAYKLINGDSIDSFIDTGINYVDASTLNDPDVEILLYPMGKDGEQ